MQEVASRPGGLLELIGKTDDVEPSGPIRLHSGTTGLLLRIASANGALMVLPAEDPAPVDEDEWFGDGTPFDSHEDLAQALTGIGTVDLIERRPVVKVVPSRRDGLRKTVNGIFWFVIATALTVGVMRLLAGGPVAGIAISHQRPAPVSRWPAPVAVTTAPSAPASSPDAPPASSPSPSAAPTPTTPSPVDSLPVAPVAPVASVPPAAAPPPPAAQPTPTTPAPTPTPAPIHGKGKH